MSQTLPDLVVSPCPAREPLANFYLRYHVMLSCGRWDGFSLHPSWEGAVVVNYWDRFADFDADPATGTLDRSVVCWMSAKETEISAPVAWLRERLPQIPASESAGTFHAVVEDVVVAIDVRVVEDAVYFRLRDHRDRRFDSRRATSHLWRPAGMETYMGVDNDFFVHFRPKQPPKFEWTLFHLFQRFARSGSSQDREERGASSRR